ncbi:MAG: hypothetical protein WC365_02040 [Candidatus Babeliales bacterium]
MANVSPLSIKIMYNFLRKIIVAFILVGCTSSAVAAASLPPQVEQVKKILAAEKEQWAYIEKVFGEKLAENSDQGCSLWFKRNPISAIVAHVLLSVGGGIVAAPTAAIVMAVCDVEANMKNTLLAAICIGVVIEAALATLTRYFAELPEFSPSTCSHAFESFISKWPAHREKVPHMLQGMFDDMYKQRANQDFSAQQAQRIVEGIMAFAQAAQAE